MGKCDKCGLDKKVSTYKICMIKSGREIKNIKLCDECYLASHDRTNLRQVLPFDQKIDSVVDFILNKKKDDEDE